LPSRLARVAAGATWDLRDCGWRAFKTVAFVRSAILPSGDTGADDGCQAGVARVPGPFATDERSGMRPSCI